MHYNEDLLCDNHTMKFTSLLGIPRDKFILWTLNTPEFCTDKFDSMRKIVMIYKKYVVVGVHISVYM